MSSFKKTENQRKNRVLIVDDNPANLQVLGKILDGEGYDLAFAMSGEQAIEMVMDIPPDIILLDVIMPGIDGFETCEKIKNQPNLIEIPIIFITAMDSIEDKTRGFNVGAVDYITKPFDGQEVLSRVKTHLMLRQTLIQKENLSSHLLAIFNSVSDGIAAFDENLIITQANFVFGNILGFDAEELVRKNINDIIPEQLKVIASTIEETIKSGIEVRHTKIDFDNNIGEHKTIIYTTAPLSGNGNNHAEGIVVFRDITQLTQLEEEVKNRNRYHDIIGSSTVMQEIYALLDNLSGTDSTVLICGETGVGKEVLASVVHNESKRAKGPFIKVNCSALAENLLESELFGHVKGSFTGAISDRVGRFEAAKGGTIFLDEIGELSQQMQLKLLRVLQEKEFEKVGTSNVIKADVRIIAATNQNLDQLISDEKFRMDLYYRLNVFRIDIPPLSKRGDDLQLFIDYFRLKLNQSLDKSIEAVSINAQNILKNYNWPGNVRELSNVLERAFIVCNDNIIMPHHLPNEILANSPKTSKANELTSKQDVIEEREEVLSILTKYDWNLAKTARKMGVARTTLYRRLKKLGIEYKDK